MCQSIRPIAKNGKAIQLRDCHKRLKLLRK